jgi:hypothetical protein
MLRQKTYHDRKSYWESFQVGDIVYVFFPKHKIGCSPKFTFFWRGPFTVPRIITDVLYEVDCGRKARLEIIHCGRDMSFDATYNLRHTFLLFYERPQDVLVIPKPTCLQVLF